MIRSFFNGRLVSDAETKVSKNGNKYLSMRMATDDYVNGNKETVWVNVTCHLDQYLNISQYLTKGKPLFVCGRTRITAYKNKNNEAVPSIDIIADSIEFISTNKSNSDNGEQKNAEAKEPTVNEQAAQEVPSVEVETATVSTPIDDLPF